MNLHYYGMLDNPESCFTFQAFEMEGAIVYIQNSPRFGYEPATMNIANPALFIEKDSVFYRFVIENFKITVINGKIMLDGSTIIEIMEGASIFID